MKSGGKKPAANQSLCGIILESPQLGFDEPKLGYFKVI